VNVRTVAADVSQAAGVQSVMRVLLDSGVPLAGVLHGAAVLDDGVLLRQTRERFAAVMGPKADGAWRLHGALVQHGLRPDFFALYSSMSAVLGSPGQGNYVAANAFLDALARHRSVRDEGGCSIAWGAWKEVGMAARGSTVERAASAGLKSLAPQEGLQALSLVLRDGFDHVAVAPIDWNQLQQQFGNASMPPLFEDVVAAARAAGGAAGAAPTRTQVVDYSALAAPERQAQLIDLVRHELATVLALPDGGRSIVNDQPFGSLGLDSLTSVELRNRLQRALGRPVAATAAFEWPSVAELAAHLGSMFGDAAHDDTREEVTL
jgi:acyl carrier protein